MPGGERRRLTEGAQLAARTTWFPALGVAVREWNVYRPGGDTNRARSCKSAASREHCPERGASAVRSWVGTLENRWCAFGRRVTVTGALTD